MSGLLSCAAVQAAVVGVPVAPLLQPDEAGVGRGEATRAPPCGNTARPFASAEAAHDDRRTAHIDAARRQSCRPRRPVRAPHTLPRPVDAAGAALCPSADAGRACLRRLSLTS